MRGRVRKEGGKGFSPLHGCISRKDFNITVPVRIKESGGVFEDRGADGGV